MQPSRFYAVEVFFCSHVICATDATPREERLVGERLRHEPCVRRVVYTSKAQALKDFKKEHPKIVGAIKLPSNPLPDSFKVTPDKSSCAPSIAAAARAAHWPGVQRILVGRVRPPR